MTFKISIKEVREAVVCVEAKLTNRQLNRLNSTTGQIQMITCLSQKIQHLNKTKSPSFRGALII